MHTCTRNARCPVPVAAGSVDQLVDLRFRQMLPRSLRGIRPFGAFMTPCRQQTPQNHKRVIPYPQSATNPPKTLIT